MSACSDSPAKVLTVHAWQVIVTASCARRDLYDLRTNAVIPQTIRPWLSSLGTTSGGESLWITDVPNTHRITVAVASGRVVVLPRMEPTHAAQRRSAEDFFAALWEQLARYAG
ncbi:MAG: hypothetical protein Q8Q09_09935 [Deltaproteobacteria bacterium]|nr:hypothetical protein [Deltaproteobacteria bacterium]